MRYVFLCAAVLFALSSSAAERAFRFGDYATDYPPPGFRSVVAGEGKPGNWKVLLEDVSKTSSSSTSNAPSLSKKAVLAQVSHEPLDRRFPMLIFDKEAFGDFTLNTRFEIADGILEQTAGIVFRYQNKSNFYVVCASASEHYFHCYKVQNGTIAAPFGPQMEISKGWHDLVIQTEGTRIRCALDGKDLIKLADNTFTGEAGKIGFWTKSDTVAYFGDTTIQYTPKEVFADALVRDALKKYPRLLGLKIFVIRSSGTEPTIIASDDKKEIGQSGGETEQNVIAKGLSYIGKERGDARVTLPLRDRNGDPIAAVRVVLKTLPGQTTQNLLIRAQPVVREMQARVKSLQELLK
jgi:hypothetical protein